MKTKLIEAGLFLKKNWYASILTVGSVLIGVEVVGVWAGFGVPFMLAFGYAIYRISK